MNKEFSQLTGHDNYSRISRSVRLYKHCRGKTIEWLENVLINQTS